MAVFTRVSEAELVEWLHGYSLGRLLEMQGIPSGIENTNYFVTTSNGRFVLTLFEKLSADELAYYLGLMAHLSRHGIPCPAPVADKHDRLLGELHGKPACIVSRLAGASVTQPAPAQCAAVGAMLGQLHVAGQNYPQTMRNPRGAAWRELAAQKVRGFLAQEEQTLLDSEMEWQAGNRLEGLPQGVVHADLFRDNVLFDGERVGGLIDFYFACNDSLLYDLAITANDWCADEAGRLEAARTRALLDAYGEVRPLSAAEKNAWPAALRAAALRFWLSRLWDKHLPRDGEMVHAHDPDQFKRILQQHVAAGGAAVAD